MRICVNTQTLNEEQNESLTSMGASMNFKIFTSSKYFSTCGKRTWKWLLTGVYTNMIHKLIFSFECFTCSWAIKPIACVICTLRTTDMFNRQMFYQNRQYVQAQSIDMCMDRCSLMKVMFVMICQLQQQQRLDDTVTYSE